MKSLVKSLVVTVVMVCGINPLYAGSGHAHSHDSHDGHNHAKLTKVEVQKIARKKLDVLVKNKKIGGSWAVASILSTKTKKFKHATEWVVDFRNSNVRNKHEQIIYIFVSMHGEVTGANYTGK